jgi:hypothetical protein
MVTALALAGAQWWQAGLLMSDELTTETAEQSDGVIAMFAVFLVGSLIACATTFIMWFRRAYANLHRLNSGSILSYEEGWAAGAWFVPFLNLVRPFTIMKEIWNETQSNIPGKEKHDGIQGTALIGWWWAAWLTYNIVTNATSRMNQGTDPESLASYLRTDAVTSLLVVPAALLAIQVVLQTNRFEQELYSAHRMSDPSEHLVV